MKEKIKIYLNIFLIQEKFTRLNRYCYTLGSVTRFPFITIITKEPHKTKIKNNKKFYIAYEKNHYIIYKWKKE